MVKGVAIFKEHFRDSSDRYVLIGGTACDLAMTEAGLEFRATKDLDIVLCLEALDTDFARAFWDFIALGQYQIQEKASGQKQFYRFKKPGTPGYPSMLELFSRVPDALSHSGESRFTPIPVSDEVSSLSAILLNDVYYRWILEGKRPVEGINIVGAEHLIPLKAKAWLDLTARKEGGTAIDSRDIRKHKNDVFRLFPVLNPQPLDSVHPEIQQDLDAFLQGMEAENIDLKNLGVGRRNKADVMTELRRIYRLSD